MSIEANQKRELGPFIYAIGRLFLEAEHRRLNVAVRAAVDLPGLAARWRDAVAETTGQTAEELNAAIRAEFARAAKSLGEAKPPAG